ncbi:MAG: hypothetical protein L6R19_26190 [Alphaproteobacteria bacterium]|nr:hypothetical protein [Burkholderiaceae bacterium]MCK6454310.1 hypothetical protein [Alphaproteobacteria bacterium]
MTKRIAGMIAVALGSAALVAEAASTAVDPAVDPKSGTRGPTRVLADCTCRYDGRSYEFGTVVCLRTPQGLRLARCGMVQNNTFWDYLDQPCPLASPTPDAQSNGRKLNPRLSRPPSS